jgi:hypothetical protein
MEGVNHWYDKWNISILKNSIALKLAVKKLSILPSSVQPIYAFASGDPTDRIRYDAQRPAPGRCALRR